MIQAFSGTEVMQFDKGASICLARYHAPWKMATEVLQAIDKPAQTPVIMLTA